MSVTPGFVDVGAKWYGTDVTHELNRQGVRRVTYDGVTEHLQIEFARGQVYVYDAVPEGIVNWLVRTKDPGGYIQRVVTPRFAYRRVDAPSVVRSLGVSQDLEAQLRASLARLGKTPNDT